MGVEPIGDTARCHPPVLKTGTITGPHALPLCIINNTQQDDQRFWTFQLRLLALDNVRHPSRKRSAFPRIRTKPSAVN